MIVGAQFLVIIPPVVTQCPEWESIVRCDFTVCASLYTQISTGHHKHLHIVLPHIRPRIGNFRSPKRKGGDKPVNGPTFIVNTGYPILTKVAATGHPRIHRKYRCALPINPSHIASIPHTSSLQLHISLAEWNDTTREPYTHQPLHRYLWLQQIQAPHRIPPQGEEADCLWTPLRKGSTCDTRYLPIPQPRSSPPTCHRTNQELLSK